MSEEEKNTKQEAEEQPAELDKKWEFKPGPVILVGLAVIALIFVLWLIFAIWTAPAVEDTPPPTPPEPAEEVEVPVNPAFVPDRDPEVLGLRIDTVIGRFFTERDTGRTLYINKGDCDADCQADWTPYAATEAVVDGGDFSTVERTDGTLQYAWKGKGLYTFSLDDDRSVLGDGYAGTWRIARP